jgi:hypothetical protein
MIWCERKSRETSRGYVVGGRRGLVGRPESGRSKSFSLVSAAPWRLGCSTVELKRWLHGFNFAASAPQRLSFYTHLTGGSMLRSRFRSCHEATQAAACLAWCGPLVSCAPLLIIVHRRRWQLQWSQVSSRRRTPAGVALDHPAPVRYAQVAVIRFQVAGVAVSGISPRRCRSHARHTRRACV